MYFRKDALHFIVRDIAPTVKRCQRKYSTENRHYQMEVRLHGHGTVRIPIRSRGYLKIIVSDNRNNFLELLFVNLALNIMSGLEYWHSERSDNDSN